MKSILTGFLMLLALAPAQASPEPGADTGYQAEDWGRMRRDVNESARRPGANGDFEARRQALRERARTKFREADQDGNGGLSQSELSRVRPAMAKHFDLIDSNHDGQVTEREIAEAWKKRMQQRRQQSGEAGRTGSNQPRN